MASLTAAAAPNITRFINVGCWHKWNKERINNSEPFPLVKILEDSKTETPMPNFYIFNGDNYYQDKVKDKSKGTETLTVNEANIRRGFEILKQGTDGKEVFILTGNQDLKQSTDNGCETIKNEKQLTTESRDDGSSSSSASTSSERIKLPTKLVMFKHVGNTLIIMIDTNMYNGEILDCYDEILDEATKVKIKEIESGLDASLGARDKKTMAFQTFQKNEIKNEIKKELGKNSGHYKNIIICGHHPLIGAKNSRYIAKLKNQQINYKFKQGIDAQSYELYDLLLDISKYGEKFFYLCADIHNYQKGAVDINRDGEQMQIEQYIVGTGGAELDDKYSGIFASGLTEQTVSSYFDVHELNKSAEIMKTKNGIVDEMDAHLNSNARKNWDDITIVITPTAEQREKGKNIVLKYKIDEDEHQKCYGYLVVDINLLPDGNEVVQAEFKRTGNEPEPTVKETEKRTAFLAAEQEIREKASTELNKATTNYLQLSSLTKVPEGMIEIGGSRKLRRRKTNKKYKYNTKRKPKSKKHKHCKTKRR
jgi:hypothetical protein